MRRELRRKVQEVGLDQDQITDTYQQNLFTLDVNWLWDSLLGDAVSVASRAELGILASA